MKHLCLDEVNSDLTLDYQPPEVGSLQLLKLTLLVVQGAHLKPSQVRFDVR